MKLLLVVAAALAVASCANDSMVDPEFQAWKIQFERSYNSSSEEDDRMQIWLRNREVVLRHNALADQGNSSYRLGMTNFADMEHEEFTRSVSHGCLSFSNASRPRQGSTFQRSKIIMRTNDSVDWREEGYVTPVKDQRDCGSCWAFSTTGSLEGQHFKQTGKLVSLSEQQLVDCSGKYGNEACHGGYVEEAFNYIMDNGGIDTEDSYPYKAEKGECRVKNNTTGARCTGYVHIPAGDEDALKEAVATIGPISVDIHTSDQLSHLYTSGVYDEPGCSSTDLTHAVLIVGYGEEGGKDYWLVKNSWGPSWGEKGYIKMKRNSTNQCGIASAARFPLVAPPVSNLNITSSFDI